MVAIAIGIAIAIEIWCRISGSIAIPKAIAMELATRRLEQKWLEEAVGRILYPEGRRPFIWAARHHAARAANPGTSPTQGGIRGQATLGPPIRPCSAWGLPCPLRFRRGGALLPHPFTLTPGLTGGGLLSAALSLALPRPGVTRHAVCHGVRTFL